LEASEIDGRRTASCRAAVHFNLFADASRVALIGKSTTKRCRSPQAHFVKGSRSRSVGRMKPIMALPSKLPVMTTELAVNAGDSEDAEHTMAEDTIARAVQRIPCEPQPVPRSGKRYKVDFQLLHFADHAPVPLLLASHGSRSASIHHSLAAGPRPTCPAVRSS